MKQYKQAFWLSSCVCVLLTAFNFQGAVLFIKRVPPQVHHASSSGGYSKKKKEHNKRLMCHHKDTSSQEHRYPVYCVVV